MRPNILTVQEIATSQAVASSIVPVVVGSSGANNLPWSVTLGAGKRLYWEVVALFTLGATGGFRFLANVPAAPTVYNAQYQVIDLTTPTTFNAGQTAEAAFANASAVASTYILRAYGNVTNGVTAGTFSFEFAQNTSDVLPITILAGGMLKVIQY